MTTALAAAPAARHSDDTQHLEAVLILQQIPAQEEDFRAQDTVITISSTSLVLCYPGIDLKA
jgi:hypothetical protein